MYLKYNHIEKGCKKVSKTEKLNKKGKEKVRKRESRKNIKDVYYG